MEGNASAPRGEGKGPEPDGGGRRRNRNKTPRMANETASAPDVPEGKGPPMPEARPNVPPPKTISMQSAIKTSILKGLMLNPKASEFKPVAVTVTEPGFEARARGPPTLVPRSRNAGRKADRPDLAVPEPTASRPAKKANARNPAPERSGVPERGADLTPELPAPKKINTRNNPRNNPPELVSDLPAPGLAASRPAKKASTRKPAVQEPSVQYSIYTGETAARRPVPATPVPMSQLSQPEPAARAEPAPSLEPSMSAAPAAPTLPVYISPRLAPEHFPEPTTTLTMPQATPRTVPEPAPAERFNASRTLRPDRPAMGMYAMESASGRQRGDRGERRQKEPIFEQLERPQCPICVDDVQFVAVGRCNHHICSMCALRMRVKSKNKQCAICKEEMRAMVVYCPDLSGEGDLEALAFKPFNSFGLSEDDCDVDAANLPGIRSDPVAGFLYVDCAAHFTQLEELKAVVCPLRSCRVRFSSVPALQKHLAEAHHGLTLCTLCVDNRPIFISEHRVMNKRLLIKHQRGEETAAELAQSTTENIHTTGHPSCSFCLEPFFDKAALYAHMQRTYFTCHLCPQQHMFRYYIDALAIQEHHRRDHIVCSICEAVPSLVEAGVAISFRDVREYSEHMRHFHNTANAAVSSQRGSSFRLGAPAAGYNYQSLVCPRRTRGGLQVVDLDMGSANPYSQPDGGTEVENGELLMRAANDGTGSTGRSDRPRAQRGATREQAFPTLQSTTGAGKAKAPGRWGTKDSAQRDEGTMGASDDPPLPAPSASASLHPLSLVHASRQSAKEALQKKEQSAREQSELEQKRVQRNIALASALLGDSKGDPKVQSANLTAADVGATMASRSYIDSLLSSLRHLRCSEGELMRTLYPPVLVAWARQHKVDLLKVEKKIYSLLEDPQVNSVQLKPMGRGMRMLMHQLSRLYLLNSYEFDAEPSRYVSLVRQVDSYLPAWPLSRAAALPDRVLPPAHKPGFPLHPDTSSSSEDSPVLYLTLINEVFSSTLANTNSSVATASKQAGREGVRVAFTCAEVLSRATALLQNPTWWRAWYDAVVEAQTQHVVQQLSMSMPDEPLPPGLLAAMLPRARELSSLPVPVITAVFSGGPTGVGLEFKDCTAARLALHLLEYCALLHHARSSKFGIRASEQVLKAPDFCLSGQMEQEIAVAAFFHLHPAFRVCSAADLIFETTFELEGKGPAPEPALRVTAVPSAAPGLDPRHFMASTTFQAKPASVGIGAGGMRGPDDGWQMQAVKSKAFDAVGALGIPFDTWEDLDDMDKSTDAQGEVQAERAQEAQKEAEGEKAEAWELYLQEKRAAHALKGAPPQYQAKKPEMQEVKEVKEKAEEKSFEEPIGALAALNPRTKAPDAGDMGAAEGAVMMVVEAEAAEAERGGGDCAYGSDYVESEEDFQLLLERLQMDGAEVQAQSYNVAQAGSAMYMSASLPAVAVPLDEEEYMPPATVDELRAEERAQLHRQAESDRRNKSFNKFGLLDDEEDAED